MIFDAIRVVWHWLGDVWLGFFSLGLDSMGRICSFAMLMVLLGIMSFAMVRSSRTYERDTEPMHGVAELREMLEHRDHPDNDA